MCKNSFLIFIELASTQVFCFYRFQSFDMFKVQSISSSQSLTRADRLTDC